MTQISDEIKFKIIQDTVHGHIDVPLQYFEIIDTPEFQRLRRVEQTSIRALFPAARHDRFIHSLGVYDFGHKMVEHLKRNSSITGVLDDVEGKTIISSFEIACLLHDVGHAPFSHSFEDRYGSKTELMKRLKKSLTSSDFGTFNTFVPPFNVDSPAYHEYASAILAVTKFGDKIEKFSADKELVARMIIGYQYKDETKSLRNCFISLLNGGVVDADRLDYVCRDVWASGYSTSTIDVDRLIRAMDIRIIGNGNYVVCYSNKAINEIESLINIKDFQVKYVINHHSVVYDQYLLNKAAELMAKNLYPSETYALEKMISIDSLCTPWNENINGIAGIADEDLLHLMKKDVDGNNYYQEWYSRSYKFFPLWKSVEEFYHFFDIDRHIDLSLNNFNRRNSKADDFYGILQDYGYGEADVVLRQVKFKERESLNNVMFIVGNEVVNYESICGSVDERDIIISDLKSMLARYGGKSIEKESIDYTSLINEIKIEIESFGQKKVKQNSAFTFVFLNKNDKKMIEAKFRYDLMNKLKAAMKKMFA